MTSVKLHDATPIGHPAVHQGHFCGVCLRDVRDPIHGRVVRWDLLPLTRESGGSKT
jgi:hypothetical protein